MALPRDEGIRIPPAWIEQERCWMAWPCSEGRWGEAMEAARGAFAQVAKAIAEFEPVTMLANAGDVAEVSLSCGTKVATLPMPHDDSWMRDMGPIFVLDAAGRVAGIDGRFNAWGESYQPFEQDAAVAEAVLAHLNMERLIPPMMLEGGAISVDGEGTLITSESCLLGPLRNPGLSRADLEAKLRHFYGIDCVIWLGAGLQDDETGGHVDNLACFVEPGVVLALVSDDPEDGNHAALEDNLSRLQAAKDARGRALEVVEVQQPGRVDHEDGRRLSLSYINLYIANGGVVMPAFEDSQDQPAFETVGRCFPDRRVVQIPALDIVHGGGGIHSITLDQPKGDSPRGTAG
jgi:agmatine deiminase